jgi:hypothetical protein
MFKIGIGGKLGSLQRMVRLKPRGLLTGQGGYVLS